MPRHVFTGVGSRRTPTKVLNTMRRLAAWMARAGWTLRSGSAAGADSAWEEGMLEAGGTFQSFLPWAGFNNREGDNYVLASQEQLERALDLVGPTHPNWGNLNASERKLHARNSFQILGLELSQPSALLLCWTEDGCRSGSTRSARTGGTGTAIVLAETFGVPIVNMAVNGWEQRLWAYWSVAGTSLHWMPAIEHKHQKMPTKPVHTSGHEQYPDAENSFSVSTQSPLAARRQMRLKRAVSDLTQGLSRAN